MSERRSPSCWKGAHRGAAWAGLLAGTVLGLAARPVSAIPLVPWLDVHLADPHHSRLPASALVPAPDRAAALAKEGHAYIEMLDRTEIAHSSPDVIDQTSTHVRHFLLDEGVRGGGNLSFVVSPLRERAEIVEAWAYLPGGERIGLDPAVLQISSTDASGLFSDERRVTVPFSGLVPGATVVLIVRRHQELRKFPLRWSSLLLTQGAVPVESFELLVHDTRERVALSVAGNDPDLSCERHGGELACRRRQVAPVKFDPDVDTWLDWLPHVVIAEPQSWQDLADAERALVEQHADADDPRVRQLSAELTAGAISARDRLERLHRFVADQIRYVGIEQGRGAVEPRRASVTLQRGFGDCKDKVTLFLALAKSAGVGVVPVLVATSLRNPKSLLLPSSIYFDHMIACTADGSELCVDLTAAGLALGELPLGVRNRVAFAIGERYTGVFQLELPGAAFDLQIDTHMAFACDGSISETVERQFLGASSAMMRSRMRGEPSTQRQRWLEEEHTRVVGDGRTPVFELPDLDKPGPTFRLRSKTEVGGSAGERPEEIAIADPWLVEYAKGFHTKNRHHAYRTDGVTIESRVSIDTCPDLPPRFLGPRLAFHAEFGSLTRQYKKDGNRVIVETKLSISAQEIAVDRIPDYNRFLDQLLGETTIWFSRFAQGAAVVRR